MLAGRPHEAAGNGSPRWMTAASRQARHRTRPTGRLTPIHASELHGNGWPERQFRHSSAGARRDPRSAALCPPDNPGFLRPYETPGTRCRNALEHADSAPPATRPKTTTKFPTRPVAVPFMVSKKAQVLNRSSGHAAVRPRSPGATSALSSPRRLIPEAHGTE